MVKINFCKNCQKFTTGFTLIELIITVGMLVVIGSITMFNLFGFFQRKNLDSDALTIAYTLRAAHDKSVSQEDSSQWGVHFDNVSGQNFYTLFEGAAYVSSTPSNMKKILSPGVVFSSPAAATSTDFVFSKLYGLPAASGTVIIMLEGNAPSSRTISVSSNGMVGY